METISKNGGGDTMTRAWNTKEFITKKIYLERSLTSRFTGNGLWGSNNCKKLKSIYT